MEDIIVLYNVPHPEPFGFLITLFVSVTGLNSGSYIASFIFTYLGKKDYLPLAKFSALAVMLLWVIAPLLLLLDIGQPLRFWHLFAYFNPESPLSWGTLVLTAYPFTAAVYVYYLFREELGKAMLWGFIGLPVALGSHAFTGFVLSFSKTRVLWSSSLIPIFFLLTAALSGFALVLIFDTLRYYFVLKGRPGAQAKEKLIFHQLGEALYLLILADLALVFAYLLKVGISPEILNEVLDLAAGGKIHAWDLIIPIVLGLIAPLLLFLYARTNRRPWVQMAASLLVVWGNFSLASLMMSTAQRLPLL